MHIWGRVAEAGDLAAGSKAIFQGFKANANKVLMGLRAMVIFYNNPTIDGLRCAIYSDDASTGTHLPSTLILNSTKVWTKAEIITTDNGFKEIYFDFDKLPLQQSSWYHAVFYADTYTPSSSEHVSFAIGFPDPIYTLNQTVDLIKLQTLPISISLIGADF